MSRAIAIPAAMAMLALLGGMLLLTALIGAIGHDATPTSSSAATLDIPARYLTDYQAAARTYGLNWTILAGIGEVETDHGRLNAPGVTSGVNTYGCCAGPMQFSIVGGAKSVWAAYAVDGNDDGITDVYDPDDAIPAAARKLHADGAPKNYPEAIYAYNHSQAYVQAVLTWAGRYAALTTPTSDQTGQVVQTAISTALAYLGTPYVWGGNSPVTGFDCSGLVQYAYAQAGIALPRTTYQQWTAGIHIAPNALQPGDIVFFDALDHEGLYLGQGRYVEAPHTGANVRISTLDTTSSSYVGAVRPFALSNE